MVAARSVVVAARRRRRRVVGAARGRAQAGAPAVPTAQELADGGNLAGALNYWAGQAAPPLPVDIQPEIAYGDYSRKVFAASKGVVTAFPFRMPAHGTTHVAAAEYAGQPWLRLMTVSMIAGDLTGPMRSAGKNPDIYIAQGDFPVGTLLYANNVLTDDAIPGSTGTGFSVVWP